jgi:hypothetical protein
MIYGWRILWEGKKVKNDEWFGGHRIIGGGMGSRTLKTLHACRRRVPIQVFMTAPVSVGGAKKHEAEKAFALLARGLISIRFIEEAASFGRIRVDRRQSRQPSGSCGLSVRGTARREAGVGWPITSNSQRQA